MANYVVFLDQEHAKIFELHPEKVEEHSLRRHEVRHHTGSEKDHSNHAHAEKFYHEVAAHLTAAHEILVIGPGGAKGHFRDYLAKHSNELTKKIVGVETVDHPTDGQIVAMAKKFFKAHLQFEE